MNQQELRQRLRASSTAAATMRDRETDPVLRAQARGQADAYFVIGEMVSELRLADERNIPLERIMAAREAMRAEIEYTYQYNANAPVRTWEGNARYFWHLMNDMVTNLGGMPGTLMDRPLAASEPAQPAQPTQPEPAYVRFASPRDQLGRFMPITSMPPPLMFTSTWMDDTPAPTGQRGLYGWDGSTATDSQRYGVPFWNCNCAVCTEARARTPFVEGMREGTP